MSEEKYLTFIMSPTKPKDICIINNKEHLYIGRIERMRVGTWMSWCLFLEKDCYLSASCQDEVREATRKLNSRLTKSEEVKQEAMQSETRHSSQA
jgi:hypothetical protein